MRKNYKELRESGEKEFKKLPQRVKNKWKKEFDLKIEKVKDKIDLINHIFNSPLIKELFWKEFESFFSNYSNVLKISDILISRKKDLQIIFEKLFYKKISEAHIFLNNLRQIYEAHGKIFNQNMLEISADFYKSEIKEIFMIPNLFVDVLRLNDKTWGEQMKEVNQKLSIEQNKRRTFNLEFLQKIKEIEIKTKSDIPKPTQSECVILANKELNEFNYTDLIDEYHKPTELLLSIRNSYKAQKKTL